MLQAHQWRENLRNWLQRHRGVLIIAATFWGLGLYMGWGRGGGGECGSSASAPPVVGSSGKQKSAWSGRRAYPTQLAISRSMRALAEIRTSRVMHRPVFLSVRMVGRVTYDETRVKTITSWISGRLEKMYVDYTGIRVRRGDHLVKIYSPALLVAQQELLQASQTWKRDQRRGRRGVVQHTTRLTLTSARQKLALLGLQQWQIRNIEKQGKPLERVNIHSPMGGIVIRKKALEGMYVTTGTPLYTIADLSHVWVRFEAYERDLAWLFVGQTITFTTLAAPGRVFTGEVVYIDPVLDPKTRTVRVRVNARNPDGLLKPDMFVRGVVQVSLNAEGRARTLDRTGQWVCRMHPEVSRTRRGRCPSCGMALERIKRSRVKTNDQDPLVIPATAPLLTGKRAIVYVRQPWARKPTYEGREVVLGPRAGPYFVVLGGLQEDEEVVTHGAFQLDSELQVQVRPRSRSRSVAPDADFGTKMQHCNTEPHKLSPRWKVICSRSTKKSKR